MGRVRAFPSGSAPTIDLLVDALHHGVVVRQNAPDTVVDVEVDSFAQDLDNADPREDALPLPASLRQVERVLIPDWVDIKIRVGDPRTWTLVIRVEPQPVALVVQGDGGVEHDPDLRVTLHVVVVHQDQVVLTLCHCLPRSCTGCTPMW